MRERTTADLREDAALDGAEVAEEAQQELLVVPEVGIAPARRRRNTAWRPGPRCRGQRWRRAERRRRGRRRRQTVSVDGRIARRLDRRLPRLLRLRRMVVVMRRQRRRGGERAHAVGRRAYHARYRAGHAASAAAASRHRPRRRLAQTGSDVIAHAAVLGRGRRARHGRGAGLVVRRRWRRLATEAEAGLDGLG